MSDALADWSQLCREAVAITPLSGGRNSQVVRLLASDGRSWIGKRYFRHPGDPRDRMTTELNALQACRENGIQQTPRLLGRDADRGQVLLEDFGCGVVNNPTADEVAQLAEWLLDLQGLQKKKVHFPAASEACFTAQEIIVNLRQRQDRLLQIPNDSDVVGQLRTFLLGHFAVAINKVEEVARQQLSVAGICWEVPLPQAERILSPSDFGFHNACRRVDGLLGFFDLEYFGWDDPTKLLCDFALHRHPLMQLPAELKRMFIHRILQALPQPARVQVRAMAYYRLFRFKWCLIMLNEFLPVENARRRFAGVCEDRNSKTLQPRLDAVQLFFHQTESAYEQFRSFLA